MSDAARLTRELIAQRLIETRQLGDSETAGLHAAARSAGQAALEAWVAAHAALEPSDLEAARSWATDQVQTCAVCGAVYLADEDCPRCPAAGASPSASAATRPLPATGSGPCADTALLDAEQAALRDVGRLPGAARIGRYTVLRQLGEGGMGVVYLVHDPELGREVALKTIRGEAGGGPGRLARFEREVRAAARLRHPNIVAIHDVGLADGAHYYTMDYVRGQSLSDAIADGQIHQHRACEIAARLARALDYAHSEGVVHRDVKPDNVLIDTRGEPQLADFGIALHVDDARLTRAGVPIGTPLYMSPEQAQGEIDHIDGRSDVFSLGAMLYEMLAGWTPVQAEPGGPEALLRLIDRVCYETPRSIRRDKPQIHRDAETIALKALAKRPHQRYASAGAMADDLERHLRDEPIAARPPGLGERLLRWVRRHKARTALIAVLAALPLIGAALVVSERRRDQRRLAQLMVEAGRLADTGTRDALMAARDRYAQVLERTPAHFAAFEGRVTVVGALRALDERERRERARPYLDRGRAALADAHRALEAAGALRARRDDAIRGRRRPEARRLGVQRGALLATARRHLEQAQGQLARGLAVSELPSARALLNDAFMRLAYVAEATGDVRAAAVYVRLVRDHVSDPERLATLEARGSLRVSLPVAARLTLSAVDVDADGRRQLREVRVASGRALEAAGLPAGRYLVAVTPADPSRMPVTLALRLRRGDRLTRSPELPLRTAAPTADMVYIPAGEVELGGDPGAFQALPPERVWLPGFWIGRHEVTIKDYMAYLETLQGRAFLDAVPTQGGLPLFAWQTRKDGRRLVPASGQLRPEAPVTRVTRAQASGYASWLAARRGRPVRLPDELEWECAARGPYGMAYPWGDQLVAADAVVGQPGQPARLPRIGQAPGDRSPSGIHDLGGSVAEWTASDAQGLAVVRGGAYELLAVMARAATRNLQAADLRASFVGFRLAASGPR